MNFELMWKVAAAIIQTFIFFGLGAFGVWRNMIAREGLNGWSSFVLNVLSPCLIFVSIAGNYTLEDLATAWVYPVAGFLMVGLHALCGFALLWTLRTPTAKRKATYLHMMSLNNFLYLPLIIISSLWDARHVAGILLWSVGSTVGQWSISVAVMAKSDYRDLLRKLCSANTAAVILAAAVLLCRIKLPALVMTGLTAAGNFSVPLCLTLIGASLFTAGKNLLQYPADMAITITARLVVIPALTLLLLHYLPLPETLRHLATVVAVMPGSVGSVLMVRLYGGDTDYVAQTVLSTTLTSIVTVPLLLGWVL